MTGLDTGIPFVFYHPHEHGKGQPKTSPAERSPASQSPEETVVPNSNPSGLVPKVEFHLTSFGIFAATQPRVVLFRCQGKA